MTDVVVGYQGGEGAYSHLAATHHFAGHDGEVVHRGFDSFVQMLHAVRDGDINYALLPIENSIAGSINESYDLIAELNLALVGEEIQHIDHCLIGLPGGSVEKLSRVYSHPVALAQCRKFLATLGECHIEAFDDTALSVARVKREGDPTQAAIASQEAAKIYDLPILRRDIADQKENYTRMVVVAKEPFAYPESVPCKTSLMFSTAHVQGALAKCIIILAEEGLNLTKLESRPKPESPFEYMFYVDVEGNVETPAMKEALDALTEVTSYLKVFGSYPTKL